MGLKRQVDSDGVEEVEDCKVSQEVPQSRPPPRKATRSHFQAVWVQEQALLSRFSPAMEA